MPESETPTRDAKLVQYLEEANAKEKELETSLQLHLNLAALGERKPYKKRLQDHLKETRNHSRQLERRIKKLGGGGTVTKAATKGVAMAKGGAALAKGPFHALRGVSDQEKLLKMAKTEYWNEHEEIATYNAIITLAEATGDTETAKLAKGILREEERMARYLQGLIPTLTKAVATKEIPASERRKGSGRSRRRSSSRSSSSSRKSSGSSSRSSARRSSSSGRSSGSRSSSSGSRSRSSSSRSSSSSSRRRSGSSSRSGSRSTRRS